MVTDADAGPPRTHGRAEGFASGWIDRFSAALSGAGAKVAAAGIVMIMLATTGDVARRWVTGRSIPGAVEGSEVVLVIAVFLGLGLAQRQSTHVATAVVTNRVPARIAAAMRSFGLAMVVVFALWVMITTLAKAQHSFQTGEARFGLVQVPIWPGRLAITLGFLLLSLEAALDLVHSIGNVIRTSPEEDADSLATEGETG